MTLGILPGLHVMMRKDVLEAGMNFEGLLQQRLDTLHREGRYRVFADLKRRRGSFPVADHFAE